MGTRSFSTMTRTRIRSLAGSVAKGLVVAIAVVAFCPSAMALSCTHPQGGVLLPILGDINGSGTTNVADALCCVLAVNAIQSGGQVSSVGCVGTQAVAADPTCDGAVTVADVVTTVRLALGLPIGEALAPGTDGCPGACEDCTAGGGSCLIASACVTEGNRSGADGCQVCDPASNPAGWTPDTPVTFFQDNDSDTYGVTAFTSAACIPVFPYTASVDGDCADGDSAVHPAADELCDNVDNDCDGDTDEGCGPSTGGTDCTDVLFANPAATSGQYLLDPDGAGPAEPYLAYCDMTTLGGGWTLVLNVTDPDVYAAGAAVWHNTTPSEASPEVQAITPSHAGKSPAYAAVAGRELLIRTHSEAPGYWARFALPSEQTLLELVGTTNISAQSNGYKASLTYVDKGASAHACWAETWQVSWRNYWSGDNYPDSSLFAPASASSTRSCGGHSSYATGLGVRTDTSDGFSGYGGSWEGSPSENPGNAGLTGGQFSMYVRGAPALKSCLQIREQTGTTTDGLYWVDSDGFEGVPGRQVYCDMSTAGGGWTRCLAQTFTNGNRQSIGIDAADVRNDSPLPDLAWVSAQCELNQTGDFLVRGRRDGVDAFAVKGTAAAGWMANSSGSDCYSVVDLANSDTVRQLMVIRNLAGVSGAACAVGGSSTRSFWMSDPAPTTSANHLEYTFHGADAYRRVGTTDNNDTALKLFEVFVRTPIPGQSSDHPGTSCLGILNDGYDVGSGSYWIDPDGAGSATTPTEVYCDMETDGGGWTVLTQFVGDDNAGGRLDRTVWTSNSGPAAHASDVSYVRGSLYTALASSASEFKLEVIRRNDGESAHLLYPLDGATKPFWTSLDMLAMDVHATVIDSNGSVSSYTNLGLCTSTTYSNPSRSLRGTTGLTMLGVSSSEPSLVPPNANCDWGPWASQILMMGSGAQLSTLPGAGYEGTSWSSAAYNHQYSVR